MKPDDFHTTRWSVVLAAAGDDPDAARTALADLCEAYWYPLYAYARRRGLSPEAAEDGVQGFFAAFLEKAWAGAADPARGRFRAFLLTAFRRHLGKERDRERAAKRGGGRRPLSLDFGDGERRYASEPAHVETPETLFERRWALTLLERVLAGLAAEMTGAGKTETFEALAAHLPGAGEAPPHAETAGRLGKTEAAVKVAVHRLRARYRERLREEIAQTVASPAEIDDEIRSLLAALSAPSGR
jgi:RNA polymerase sigma-70 factor (ECF subfamily)